ncbi:hypothetical protein GGTG_05268 [Gaeumannomyces tritici R3-111a-1]|uniref:Uncharacterized protein n=1 Tax=Gaeumannomyces tritici (strain R3-111a-1) TaxID=644352 RepID=J3NVF3_GAET3|nr:hypothetical protein GGTG_05268 [Gaeumannomyces tritici R3-111a-1]EJT75331.1 hypothetical protein GGTG_05268 [Gaeumannomyces tritici R3-111a-1]
MAGKKALLLHEKEAIWAKRSWRSIAVFWSPQQRKPTATEDFILIDEPYGTHVRPPFDSSEAICDPLAGFPTPEPCNARAEGLSKRPL